MVALDQINGGAGFNHDQDLRRSIGRGEEDDGLGGAGVEDSEIFLLQATDEFAVLIDDGGVQLDDFGGDLQRLLRRLVSLSAKGGAGEKRSSE